jgi:hypothetical protein
MGSLEETERMSAAVARAPRVKLKDIQEAIETRIDIDGTTLAALQIQRIGVTRQLPSPLETFSICLLVMRNGFVVIGKSAPASPENFDPELGRTYAYEDAVRQLWPLMGYALRDKLAAVPHAAPSGYERAGKSNVPGDA